MILVLRMSILIDLVISKSDTKVKVANLIPSWYGIAGYAPNINWVSSIR